MESNAIFQLEPLKSTRNETAAMMWDDDPEGESEEEGSDWAIADRNTRSVSRVSPTDYTTCRDLLSASEEIDLVRKAQEGDLRARNRMIECNIRLVISLANKYSCRSMTLEDLIQEGVFGLVEAIRKFDITLGYRFSTYATYWVRQGIVRAMEKQDRMIRLPSYGCNAEYKIKQAELKLRNQLDREPSIHEIAIETGLSRRLINMLRIVTHDPLSLDTMLGPNEDTSMLELQMDHDLAEPEDEAIRKITQSTLAQLVDRLPPREAFVIRKRYGLLGEGVFSLQEIAEELQMSREGVRHIQNRGLRWLRQMLKAPEI